ncbi:MAG: MFS transporter, partial [Christensenellaceae bacterium]|nr:MFS transporter [Christensenellaceae bacterium]
MAGELKVKTSGGIGGVVRTTSAFKGKVNRFLDKIMGKDCDNEIPRKELLKYGIGIFGQNNSCNIMGSWFNYICIFVFGFNPLIFSILFSITRVWDAINDPIVGVIIENRVSKDGEKLRPWMSRTAIPIGILAVLMFISYGDISFYGVTVTQNVHMVFVIILYMVYDFLYSFQDIAQWG